MRISQAFKLHPFAAVRGGAVSYSVEILGGLVGFTDIVYDGSATISKGRPFSITEKFSGKWSVPISALASSNYVVGYKAVFGSLAIEVKTVSPGHAYAALTLSIPSKGIAGTGMLAIDTSGPWIKLAPMADGFYGRAHTVIKKVDINLALEKA